jgi:hypothetical protein
MSHNDSSRDGLEITVRKLLESSPVHGRQPVVKCYSRVETAVQTPINIEKAAHDMRASLNIIIGFTELMLNETMGKINNEQRRSLNDILDNGQRLSRLSDEIVKRLETVSIKK